MRKLGLSLASIILFLSGCGSQPAPPKFRARFETSKGDFTIEVVRDWSPKGADRFYELVKGGFYDDNRFFRVLPGFVVQFGLKGDPATDMKWRDSRIDDDPPLQSNTPASVVFATSGPNSRTTQVFINLGRNDQLDPQGFTPFGRVVEGMSVVAELYAGYGEGFPNGNGPDQNRIVREGNAYLNRDFPRLDFIKKASVLSGQK